MKKTIVFAVACSILIVISQRHGLSATDISADLFAAIKSGDAAKVSEALSRGAKPDSIIEAGVTALIGAAYVGNAEIVKLLLNSGAKVNARSDAGLSPLMVASAYGHKEIVKLLLKKGADVNLLESEGRNAFQLAAVNGHDQIADLLRARTKGAANWRLKTVVAPLEAEQKCLPVTKSPDDASEKVGCLNEGAEVSSSGKSGDQKWLILQKPVSGWVPADKIERVLVNQGQAKPPAARSSEQRQAPSQKNESGINPRDLPSTPGRGGGSWWQRGQ